MIISDAVLVALATGLPATIASVATLINSMRNSRVLSDNTKKIGDIHDATNGMQQQLMAGQAKTSHSEGMASQRRLDRKRLHKPINVRKPRK
jgi:hypothetical protein